MDILFFMYTVMYIYLYVYLYICIPTYCYTGYT